MDIKFKINNKLICVDGISINKTKDSNDLSTQRAKAIASFLKLQGIEANRVSYKGFGSTMPLYPLPEQFLWQSAANRRVEILIVENE
jgi:flagellar motor protein MotB